MADILVSTAWLANRLGTSGICILDGTWHLPTSGRSGRADFEESHIPGAQFFDLERVSDQNSPYANMLPSPEDFAAAVRGLGISSETHIIIYDSGYVSPRVWWMFRTFGHARVSILDGGLRKWRAESRPIADGPALPTEPGDFTPNFEAAAVVGTEAVRDASQTGAKSIVDARTRERFTGEMPSGYPGVPGGHMPGAINIPWNRFYEDDHTYVSPEVAAKLFSDAGVDASAPVIATCGSGVTAAILVMMLTRLDRPDVGLYDGSWHEWGQQPELPKIGAE